LEGFSGSRLTGREMRNQAFDSIPYERHSGAWMLRCCIGKSKALYLMGKL
jgi:hypothetical protein